MVIYVLERVQSSEERRPNVTVSSIATHINASPVELGVVLPACLSRQRHARQTHAAEVTVRLSVFSPEQQLHGPCLEAIQGIEQLNRPDT